MMNARWINRFTRAAGLVLTALAAAHFIGNQGAIVMQPVDPLFQISTRLLFWALAACELVAAAFCLYAKSMIFANALLLWFMTNLAVYRLGLFYFGVATVRAYHEPMAHRFGLSGGMVSFFFTLLAACLWLGSACAVALLWNSRRSLPAVGEPMAEQV